MPALVLLGRQLRLGSDDLAVPSTVGAFWTGAWAAIVAVDLTFTSRYLSHDCPYRIKHVAFLATLLGLLVFMAIFHVAIITESTKGSLFQVGRRRSVGPLLLALMACYVAAAGSNAYGSHLLTQRREFSSEAACVAALPGPLQHMHHISLLKAIVVATWVQLFLSALCSFIIFRLLPSCSSASCFVRRLHLTLLCCVCCCIQLIPEPDEGEAEERDYGRSGTEQGDCGGGVGGGGPNGVRQDDSPVMVMARVLLHAFGGVDMTLTDYVTALTLVGVRHRHAKVAHAYGTAPPPEWLLSLPHGSMSPVGTVLLRPPVVMAMQAGARASPTPGPASSAAELSCALATATKQLQLSATQPRPQPQPAAAELEVAVPPSASAVTPQITSSGATGLSTTSVPAAVLSTAPRPNTHPLPPLESNTVHNIHATSQIPAARQAMPSESGGRGTACGISGVAAVDTEDPRLLPPPAASDQAQQEELPLPGSHAHKGVQSPAIDLSPQTVRVFGRASLSSGHTPALLHPRREWCGQREASNVTADVLEEALNYYRFTTAVYGWMMHLYLNRTRVNHCCDLCLGRGCGCCRQSTYFLRFVGPDTGPPEGACTPVKLLEREAITQVAGVPDSDILHVSYANKIGGMLPYYIALDRERRVVVLTVRGSWSADDVITDFLCEPAPLDVPGEPSEDACVLWAHRGALASARAVEADIKAQGVLAAVLAEWPDMGQEGGSEAVAGWLAGLPSERARVVAARLRGQCAGWRLVLTGHSLGAGVAALLGLFLQQQFPSLRCWAFSPPGGLISPQAAELTRRFCVSVVHAKDIIPRLGVATVEQLVQELVTAGVHCRLSKAAVLWRLVALGQQPHQSQVFRPAEELCTEQRAAMEAYCHRMQEHASRSRFADARSFQPPGHLLYVERHPKRRGHDGSVPAAGLDSDPEAAATALPGGCCAGGVRCSCNLCLLETSAKGARYVCRFIRAEDLMAGGVVISRSMLTDHFPDHILWGLEQAYQQAREAGGLPSQTSSLRMPAALPCRICKHSRSGCTATVAPLPGAPATPAATFTALPTGPAAAQPPEGEAELASREPAPDTTAPAAAGTTVAQASVPAAAQVRGELSEARAAEAAVGSAVAAVGSVAAIAPTVASEVGGS